MLKSGILVLIVGILAAAGCQSQQQFLQSKQGMAISTAVSRAQFEMNCRTATGTILSKEVVQPAVQSAVVSGIQRAEFTIGVTGCGNRKTYTVICPEGGEGCYAAGPGELLPEQQQ
jgi:hypothetical protein